MKISLVLSDDGVLTPHTKEDFEKIEQFKSGAVYEVDIKNIDTRTLVQNRALHKYFSLLAQTLNNAGLSVSKTIKIDVEWTQHTTKELLWKPIQKATLNKTSTTKLNRDEISQVYDTLNRALSLKFGVSVAFPCRDN